MNPSSPEPRAVVYSSPFIPPEWIAAHGWTPSRRRPAAAPETEGVCRFAAGFAALAGPDLRAMVFATTCDPMRRGVEIGTDERIPRFLFHVPATWQAPVAHALYREELKRLGRFLERLGGRTPAPAELSEQLDRFEAGRETLLGRREILSSRAHADEVDRFHATGEVPAGAPASSRPPAAIPLMLLGSPLRADDLHLLDLLDRAGGRVAVDATESGEREWPRRFDRRRMKEDALDELAEDASETLQAPMTTLLILGGRKDKIRPADVLGALTGEAGFKREQVGKITVTDQTTYVAVERAIAREAGRRLSAGKLKGKKVKVRALEV